MIKKLGERHQAKQANCKLPLTPKFYAFTDCRVGNLTSNKLPLLLKARYCYGSFQVAPIANCKLPLANCKLPLSPIASCNYRQLQVAASPITSCSFCQLPVAAFANCRWPLLLIADDCNCQSRVAAVANCTIGAFLSNTIYRYCLARV